MGCQGLEHIGHCNLFALPCSSSVLAGSHIVKRGYLPFILPCLFSVVARDSLPLHRVGQMCTSIHSGMKEQPKEEGLGLDMSEDVRGSFWLTSRLENFGHVCGAPEKQVAWCRSMTQNADFHEPGEVKTLQSEEHWAAFWFPTCMLLFFCPACHSCDDARCGGNVQASLHGHQGSPRLAEGGSLLVLG